MEACLEKKYIARSGDIVFVETPEQSFWGIICETFEGCHTVNVIGFKPSGPELMLSVPPGPNEGGHYYSRCETYPDRNERFLPYFVGYAAFEEMVISKSEAFLRNAQQ